MMMHGQCREEGRSCAADGFLRQLDDRKKDSN